MLAEIGKKRWSQLRCNQTMEQFVCGVIENKPTTRFMIAVSDFSTISKDELVINASADQKICPRSNRITDLYKPFKYLCKTFSNHGNIYGRLHRYFKVLHKLLSVTQVKFPHEGLDDSLMLQDRQNCPLNKFPVSLYN